MSIEELRNKKIVVGKRETERAIKKNISKKVFLARDVDEEVQKDLIGILEEENTLGICTWQRFRITWYRNRGFLCSHC